MVRIRLTKNQCMQNYLQNFVCRVCFELKTSSGETSYLAISIGCKIKCIQDAIPVYEKPKIEWEN